MENWDEVEVEEGDIFVDNGGEKFRIEDVKQNCKGLKLKEDRSGVKVDYPYYPDWKIKIKRSDGCEILSVKEFVEITQDKVDQ